MHLVRSSQKAERQSLPPRKNPQKKLQRRNLRKSLRRNPQKSLPPRKNLLRKNRQRKPRPRSRIPGFHTPPFLCDRIVRAYAPVCIVREKFGTLF